MTFSELATHCKKTLNCIDCKHSVICLSAKQIVRGMTNTNLIYVPASDEKIVSFLGLDNVVIESKEN